MRLTVIPPLPAPSVDTGAGLERMAVGQGTALRIVRSDTLATLFEDGGYSAIRRVAYSPDGQRLAVAEARQGAPRLQKAVLGGFLGWVLGDVIFLVEQRVFAVEAYPAPSDALLHHATGRDRA